ncbi:hypothetical protein GALMADRAFT_141597 [Galerina marginata CBS 339.88]|uniref:Uncharacterized protein n=1 Tax=Galerina marginata (strain CBS 339.88) TaxID=685588 RepID=A0A067SUH9_GALM3|nr:hypothetical protein GALMADRAFT_141597 [Galerina marginata CBS 339.88]
MISRHLPLITHRVQFSSKVSSTAPLVTHRLEFDRQADRQPTSKKPQLERRELTPSDAGSEGNENKDKDLESELSDLTDSEEEATQSITSKSKKIPKPAGEPGRPGSGGYSIDDALASWGKEEVLKVNKLVKKLADLKLDNTKSYNKQNGRKVNNICEEVARHHDIIQKYDDFWPIRGMLKMHLKTTSEVHRRGGGPVSNRNNNAVIRGGLTI